MRAFSTTASLAIIVAMTVSILIATTALRSMALDVSEIAALHQHGTPVGDGILVSKSFANNCTHHGGDLDCSSCPACSGIPASAPVAIVAHLVKAVAEYRFHREQAVPRLELPPPRHA